jgi:nucleotide-binding universal stress UspA family protein
MIEEILFPVDFSQFSAAIAPFVQRAATIFQSRVSLLYVCDLTSHNGFELYLRPLQEIAEEHWNIARRKLDSFLESDFPVSSCPRILRSGNTAEQIANVARSDGFDLVIMPTHAGRFRRMLLGSTTAKVLNDAACPVLTTEHAEAIVPRGLEHREWLCAIAINADSERVLDLANRGASAAGAKLSLIHVLRSCGSAKLNCAEEQKARQCITELQKSVGSNAMLHIVQGPLKDALLAAAQQSSADVLIIGRPQSESLGRLRDLTYSVIRDAPCPVLSV